MAYIDITMTRSTEVMFRIDDLGSGYNQAIRRVTLRLYEGNSVIRTINDTIPNRISSTNSWGWIGLRPNTSYRIGVVISNITGSSNVTLSKTFTTERQAEDPQLGTPSLNTRYTDTTENTITVQPNSLSGAEEYEIQLWDSQELRTEDRKYSFGSSVTFTGLSPNTSYKLRIKASAHGYHDSDWSGWYTSTTKAKQLAQPSLNTSQTSSNLVSISVAANSLAGASRFYFELWNNSQTTSVQSQNSTNGQAKFTGLTPGTVYKVRVYATGTGHLDSEYSIWYTATTKTYQPWQWTSSVATDSDFKITRIEWINFVETINLVRDAKGYNQYSFTTSTQYVYKGLPFADWIMNQAINGINDMLSYSNRISTVTKGQDIKSSLFVDIRDKLNNLMK